MNTKLYLTLALGGMALSLPTEIRAGEHHEEEHHEAAEEATHRAPTGFGLDLQGMIAQLTQQKAAEIMQKQQKAKSKPTATEGDVEETEETVTIKKEKKKK